MPNNMDGMIFTGRLGVEATDKLYPGDLLYIDFGLSFNLNFDLLTVFSLGQM